MRPSSLCFGLLGLSLTAAACGSSASNPDDVIHKGGVGASPDSGTENVHRDAGHMPQASDAGSALDAASLADAHGAAPDGQPDAGATALDGQAEASLGGDGAPQAAVHKWNPTLFAQTVDINNSTSGEASEIDILAASFVQYPGLQKIVGGYAMWRDWVTLEPTTLGEYDFSSIDATFEYLQEKIPGARFAVGLRAYANGSGQLDANAGGSVVPAYILNGGAGTYGHSNEGANGAGWAFAWNGSAYTFAFAALWNANVMDRWTQLFAALANHPITLTSGPYAGQTFTYDKHPLVEAFNDFTPDDVSMNGNPTLPSDYSSSQFLTNWVNRSAALAEAVPTTTVMLMPGFGFGDVTNQKTVVQSMVASQIAVSCTDATTEPSTNATDLSYAQHYFVGDALTSSNPIAWSTGTGTDERGKTPSMPTIQPLDFARGMTADKNTAAQVERCMNICYSTLKADHVFVSMSSSATYNPAKDWAGSTGYIAQGLLAVGGVPTANQTRPSGY